MGKLKSIFYVAEKLVLTKLNTELGLAQHQLVVYFIDLIIFYWFYGFYSAVVLLFLLYYKE